MDKEPLLLLLLLLITFWSKVISFDVRYDPDLVSVQMGDRQYSSVDGTLQKVRSDLSEGNDHLGDFKAVRTQWQPVPLFTETKVYSDLGVTLFRQEFYGEVRGMSLNNSKSLSSLFPRLLVESAESEMAFVSFGGSMTGWTDLKIGKWATDKEVNDGDLGGALVLFDEHFNKSLVISSSERPTMANMIVHSNRTHIDLGLLGTLEWVPAEFSVGHVLVESAEGLLGTMELWGRVLRTLAISDLSLATNTKLDGKDLEKGTVEPLVSRYLGYWTDNGAFYYYNTGNVSWGYEETMKGLKSYFDKIDLPIGYVNLDSWWYSHGINDGVKEWSAKPSIFPSGLKSIHDMMEMPIQAHNRYWSPDNVYVLDKKYRDEFVTEKRVVLPIGTRFWMELMVNASNAGIKSYEQDWNNEQYLWMRATHTEPTVTRSWLLAMDKAALGQNIEVVLCMTLPRLLLLAPAMRSVKTVRVSEDYLLNQQQWRIGITSLQAHALGIAPFKDAFWSSATNPGNLYNLSEPNPNRQAVVAALSRGGVGVGDSIDHVNATLLMQTCRADGLLLRADRPAVVTPAQIRAMAFANDVEHHVVDKANLIDKYNVRWDLGEVWSTQTNLSGHIFPLVFASENSMQTHFSLKEDLDLPFNMSYIVRSYLGTVENDRGLHSVFTPSISKLHIPFQSINSFEVYYLSPLVAVNSTMRVAFLGETSKIVRISKDRLESLTFEDDNSVTVDVVSVGNEIVQLQWIVAVETNDVINEDPSNWTLVRSTCDFGHEKTTEKSMRATLNLSNLTSECEGE